MAEHNLRRIGIPGLLSIDSGAAPEIRNSAFRRHTGAAKEHNATAFFDHFPESVNFHNYRLYLITKLLFYIIIP